MDIPDAQPAGSPLLEPVSMGSGIVVGILILAALVSIITGTLTFRSTREQALKSQEACSYGAWADTGECQKGKQAQTRPVLNGVPAACGAVSRRVPCPTQTLDCIPGDPDPNAWSACPSCERDDADGPPTRWQIVPPVRAPQNGGAPCSLDEILRVESCDGKVPPCEKDQDCELDMDNPVVTACTENCGGGTRLRYYQVKTPPSGNGAPCPPLAQVESCNTQDCADCDSVDWSDAQIGPCSKVCKVDGEDPVQDLLRDVSEAGGCPVVKTQPCANLEDCNGTTVKGGCVAPTREELLQLCFLECAGVKVPALDGGAFRLTPGQKTPFCGVPQDVRDQVCGKSLMGGICPQSQDCQVSAPGDWSDCSLQCDPTNPLGGVQMQTVSVVKPQLGGGAACPPLVAERPCNNLQPVVYQDPSTTVVTKKNNGGASCDAYCGNDINKEPGVDVNSQCFDAYHNGQRVPCSLATGAGNGTLECHCGKPGEVFSISCQKQDCVLSDQWENLGECSKPCGGGIQAQVRTVVTPPKDGGALCGPTYQEVPCNVEPCEGCEWESWPAYYQRTSNDPRGLCASKADGDYVTVGPRKITKFADPGGVCDYTQAYSMSVCDKTADTCPVGCNGVVCSGHGKCSDKTAYKCQCDPGFSGNACEQGCPIGDNGLPCSGNGTCDASTDFKCQCDEGYSGNVCGKAGSFRFQVTVPAWASTNLSTPSGASNAFCVNADSTGSITAGDLAMASGQVVGDYAMPAKLNQQALGLPSVGRLETIVRGDTPSLQGLSNDRAKFDDGGPDEYSSVYDCLHGLDGKTLDAINDEKRKLGNDLLSYMYHSEGDTSGDRIKSQSPYGPCYGKWDDKQAPKNHPKDNCGYKIGYPDNQASTYGGSQNLDVIKISCGLAHFLFCNDVNNIDAGEQYKCDLDTFRLHFGPDENANDRSKCEVWITTSGPDEDAYARWSGNKLSSGSLRPYWTRNGSPDRWRPAAVTSFPKGEPNIQIFFGNNSSNRQSSGVQSADPTQGPAVLSSVTTAPTAGIPLNNAFLEGAPPAGTPWNRAYPLPDNQLAAFLDPTDVVVTSVSTSPNDCATDGYLPLSGLARTTIFQDGEAFTLLFGNEAGSYVEAADLFIR